MYAQLLHAKFTADKTRARIHISILITVLSFALNFESGLSTAGETPHPGVCADDSFCMQNLRRTAGPRSKFDSNNSTSLRVGARWIVFDRHFCSFYVCTLDLLIEHSFQFDQSNIGERLLSFLLRYFLTDRSCSQAEKIRKKAMRALFPPQLHIPRVRTPPPPPTPLKPQMKVDFV